MTTEITGSKLKSQTGRGQNQDTTPATTRDKLAPIPRVSPPNASADAGDWQTREVSAEPIEPHDGMKNRSTVQETMPSKLARK